jgi:hypothetical protein
MFSETGERLPHDGVNVGLDVYHPYRVCRSGFRFQVPVCAFCGRQVVFTV